jgi:hypothetical protein
MGQYIADHLAIVRARTPIELSGIELVPRLAEGQHRRRSIGSGRSRRGME